MSSTLVAESPSFRPRSAGSSAVSSSSSYSPKPTPSSGSSPMPSPAAGSSSAAAKGGEGYSNAVRSYVFNNPTTG